MDTTIVIDGRVGEYIVTARKKGNDWFIGAMTNWTPRELTVDLSFLDDGKYESSVLEDGVNADRYPSDYKISETQLTKTDTLLIKMAPGGGYVLRLRKE